MALSEIELLAAQIASRDPKMKMVADRVLAEVQSLAAAHSDSGEYASSFRRVESTGPHGVTDQLVVTDDPTALVKEHGRLAANGTWIDGHHDMHRAARNVRNS